MSFNNSSTLDRRAFMGRCAGCAAFCAAAPLASCSKEKKKIHIIYSLHGPVQEKPDWPNVGFDFNPHMERITGTLQKEIPHFEFVSSMANGPEEAEKLLKADADQAIDGYLVYQMNCWNKVVQTIAASGKPTLYADFQFGGSGGFLIYSSRFTENGTPNLGLVASSDINDLVKAVKCFGKSTSENFAANVTKVRVKNTKKPSGAEFIDDPLTTLDTKDCIEQLHASKILAIRNQESGPADAIMGIPIERIAFAEVNKAWKKADRDEAKSVAARWMNNAEKVIDVPEKTIVNSAAFYLGMKDVLKKHNANAITINCLGGFYGGHIHAYPCLGFHELNNEGLIGACECDTSSTATMVAFTTMTKGRPGYISDPVIDTAKGQIIYAHCVASNKVFGPDGSTNPYSIMTHSEDRQGACVRSVLPTGYLTTTLELIPERKEISLHQAVAVDNDPDDRACRTKLCAEPVGDIDKLVTNWGDWSWHRVTYYGDLKEQAYALADQVGWKVVEEV